MTDYTVGDTCHFMFTTRKFSTGAPFVLAGTPAVSAYENESLTQITAGITLGVDHDGVAGLNLLTVVASGANGFEAGKDYHLVITTGTVDSVSVVGEVVGRFTLSRSAAAVDLANGTDGLGAIKAETASILTDTAEIGAAGAGLTNINLPNQTMDITGNLSGSVGSVVGAVGSVTGNVGGNVTGSVGSVVGAVGSVTGAVGSVTGLTASDVGAIKIKTDSMTFTKALELDTNIQSVNGVTLNGDGAGTPIGV